MTSQERIEKFLQSNVEKYDLEVISQPSKFTGRRALFRAAIDKAEGGNLAVGHWESTIQEAFDSLYQDLKKELKHDI